MDVKASRITAMDFVTELHRAKRLAPSLRIGQIISNASTGQFAGEHSGSLYTGAGAWRFLYHLEDHDLTMALRRMNNWMEQQKNG